MHPAIWHWIKWDLASRKVIEELHASRPLDLIEVPEHAANGWMAGRIHAWPIVVRMHCPWELFARINRFPFNPLNRALSKLERLTVARYADALTVPSMAMRRMVAHSWQMRRQPVIIPNFMDVPAAPEPLPTDEDSPLIVCVGRIEPLKGQDTLVRAFATIAARYPRARLRLVGPDRWPGIETFAQVLHRLVPQAQVRRRIEFTGILPLDRVAACLGEARVAIIASRGFESFSYSALEAMAMARPIIATSVGALPELIEHQGSGLIVPAADPETMIGALATLLGNRALSQRYGLAAHQRARELYDTPRVLPQVMAAYGDATDFYCQVRAAGSERTAIRWRNALAAGRY